MVKLIDVDKLFDEYIEDYVYSNIGKVKPEEIENKIPQLYVKFGDEKLKQLDGKTPNTYYKQFSGAQLLECLKAHLEQGVSVSDFLCEAITENKENADVYIEMTVTSPMCPVAGVLPQQAADAVASVKGVGEVEVKIVWEPAWSLANLSDEAKEMFELF